MNPVQNSVEKRAAIFIGPEFGTVQRQDLVAAAREAGDAHFDVFIACAFNDEAYSTEFNKRGWIPVLKDHPESRDQRRSLGIAPQRHLPPLRQTQIGPDRGQGDQPPGDEVMKVFRV